VHRTSRCARCLTLLRSTSIKGNETFQINKTQFGFHSRTWLQEERAAFSAAVAEWREQKASGDAAAEVRIVESGGGFNTKAEEEGEGEEKEDDSGGGGGGGAAAAAPAAEPTATPSE